MCIIMCLQHTILEPLASLSIKLLHQSSKTANGFLKFGIVSFTKN